LSNLNPEAVERVIGFDLWGRYAHYKKIFATTTALTYPIPVKTAIYGMVGAMIGLEKEKNQYLAHFKPGECQIGIQVMRPLAFQRINTNLRAVFGQMKAGDNRKPTMMEYVHEPRYRIFITHRDSIIMDDIRMRLQERECIFTPTLGLANLLANFQWVGEWEIKRLRAENSLPIHSVIPRRRLVRLDPQFAFGNGNHIFEVSEYALEMDEERNVLDRDDIILDQKGVPIHAQVSEYIPIDHGGKTEHIVLF
jgi:CRISPR-associated protein Cas5h